MEWVIVVVIVVAIAAFVFLRLQEPKPSNAAPYKLRKQFLSAAERSFYGVLEQAVADKFKVNTKVRVADILQPNVAGDRSASQRAFNRISAKHFDYVLCEPSTMQVKAVVELNDSSHKSKNRAERDEFLAEACASAGLRLVSFEAKSQYSINAVKTELEGI